MGGRRSRSYLGRRSPDTSLLMWRSESEGLGLFPTGSSSSLMAGIRCYWYKVMLRGMAMARKSLLRRRTRSAATATATLWSCDDGDDLLRGPGSAARRRVQIWRRRRRMMRTLRSGQGLLLRWLPPCLRCRAGFQTETRERVYLTACGCRLVMLVVEEGLGLLPEGLGVCLV